MHTGRSQKLRNTMLNNCCQDVIVLKHNSQFLIFRAWYRINYRTQYDVNYTAATVPAKPVEVKEQRVVEIHSVSLVWTIEGGAEVSIKRFPSFRLAINWLSS